MTITTNKKAILFAVLLILALSVALPAFGAIKILGERIDCDPTISPSEPGGCGLLEFVAALKAVFNFLLKLALPLAGVFIVWGGVTIMTAGGSESRYSNGKSILTYAVIGLVIVLAAWLFVYTLYYVLGVAKDPEGRSITDILFPGQSFND